MNRVYNLASANEATLFEGASIAFGVFDGLHRGHRHLIDAAIDAASGGRSVVLTFDHDPDDVLRPGHTPKLMTNDARVAALSATGVDAVAVLPFTTTFASLSPLEFLDTVFADDVPAALHIGTGFRFGSKAQGTVQTLRQWAQPRGFDVVEHHLVAEDGQPISATRIRELLGRGKVAHAAELLGRPHRIDGLVGRGRGEGRDLGFRTANLSIDADLCLPAAGVYAGYALVDDRRYRAAISVGVSPLFRDRTDAVCEAHILDFDGDLYGTTIGVEFVEWLRPMIDFASVDELVTTVNGNIAWVRDNIPPRP